MSKTTAFRFRPPLGSANERYRIKVLRQYAVLDSEPEEEFDDLAAIAAHICGTPISLISLIDTDRQWFKARVGLEAKETSREHSFCAHALDNPNQIFTVKDATKDERFVNNPLVTGDPGIRFYAGAPLLTREKATLGTICVIDTVPRELNEAQEWVLQSLAEQAVKRLERRSGNLTRIDRLSAEVHDFRLEELRNLVCTSRSRRVPWLRLLSFLSRPALDPRFSYAYISGAFPNKAGTVDDFQVTLQTSLPFDETGFAPLLEYFSNGRERLHEMYSLELYFLMDAAPEDLGPFHPFFRAHAPWTDAQGVPIKVARINLRDPGITDDLHQAALPFDSFAEQRRTAEASSNGNGNGHAHA